MRLSALPTAAIAGFLGVALGAFGAHGLEDRLDATQLEWWNTGVQYHLFHALALLGVAALERPVAARHKTVLCFTAGILLFSGSLYAMALGAPTKLGMVTPLGGLAFLVGWILLACEGRKAAAGRESRP